MTEYDVHVASHVIVARAYGIVEAKSVIMPNRYSYLNVFDDYGNKFHKVPSIVKLHCFLAGMTGEIVYFAREGWLPKTLMELEERDWSDSAMDLYKLVTKHGNEEFSTILQWINDVAEIIKNYSEELDSEINCIIEEKKRVENWQREFRLARKKVDRRMDRRNKRRVRRLIADLREN